MDSGEVRARSLPLGKRDFSQGASTRDRAEGGPCTRLTIRELKKACSLCRSVTETPVPAIEAGRGRRGAAVRGRRLTLLLPTLLALC